MPCPLCDDTGWKLVEAARSRRVVRCDCWRADLTMRLLTEARIPRRYQHCDLVRFETYDNPSLLDGLERTRRLAEEFPAARKGLFLLGPPGVGKTHLAVACLKQVIATRGARGLFYDTRDLLRVIRDTYNPVVRTTEIEVLRPVMLADLLVLDDLGAEKPSEWVAETLNLIVNTRYNERRTTLFTSNYEDRPDSEAEPDTLLFRIGHRMRSRLHEMCEFVDLDGADFRMLQPNEGPADLKRYWEERQLHRKSGGGASGRRRAAKMQLRSGTGDLGWSGGKAGT